MKYKSYYVEVIDRYDRILNLLQYISKLSMRGHSFPVNVDDKFKVFIDGDGNCKIRSIEVIEKDSELSEKYNVNQYFQYKENNVMYRIVCNDDDKQIQELLKIICDGCDIGHTFYVIVDNDENQQQFYIDGDGPDFAALRCGGIFKD